MKVNGKDYKVSEFLEAFKGYTVEFKYNIADSDKATKLGVDHAKGLVKAATTVEEFKYAVQVKDEAGNVLPKDVVAADFATVKVVDETTATKVTDVQLQKDSKEWKNTVTTGDQIKIAASTYENALGQKNTDKDKDGNAVVTMTPPAIKSVKSSAPSVAYYDQTNGIQVLGTGAVTFTVTFEDIKGEFKVTANVVKEQKVTSIKAEATNKVKAETAETVKFTVLDENEEAMRVATDVFYTLTAEGKAEAKDASTVKTNANGEASITVNEKAGNYTVKTYADKDKKVALGEFKVEAVNVKEDAKIDEYKFEFPEAVEGEEQVTALDLKPDTEGVATVGELTVSVTPYVSGIAVGLPTDVKVKSSDEKVFTATLNGDKKGVTIKVPDTNAKVGKANIVLYTEEGDLVTEVATFEVEVKNTATQYETLTLKPNTKVDGFKAQSSDGATQKAAIVEAVKEEITADQIASVKVLKDDSVVLVTMEEAFGGKTIQLDAEFVEAELEGVAVKVATQAVGEVVAKDASTVEIASETLTFGKDYTDVDTLVKAINDIEGVTVTASEDGGNVKLTAKEDGNKTDEVAKLNGETSIKLANGSDDTAATATIIFANVTQEKVEAKDAVDAADGEVVFTFSEAVQLTAVEVKSLTITLNDNKEVAATEAEVSKDGKTVTAKIAHDAQNASDLKATATIKNVTGLSAVKGKIVIADEGVKATELK